MRKLGATLAIMVLAATFGAEPAHAADGDARRIANEPAATLLLPYFEAELPKKIGSKPKGVTTLFTVSNASASAALARVTIWSDLAVPVLAFNLYLTGYDTQTIDMQEILAGRIPRSASAGQDPGDAITPQGDLSQDINFASCNGILPISDLPPDSIIHVRAALTGQFSPLFNACAGLNYAEKKPIARGFVTVDDMVGCNGNTPNEPAYYNTIGTRNILFGSYTVVDKSKKSARSDLLVHIRAENNDAETLGPGSYTFYTRFEGIASTAHRQPLATTFVARYINVPKGPLFPQGTSLVVWRDPKVASAAPFACGTVPTWYPLAQDDIVAFDEQENVENADILPPVPPLPPQVLTPFGAATQKVKVDGPALPISFDQGFLYLNLNTFVPTASTVPNEDPGITQGWVTAVHESKGKFTVGTRAVHLDSATDTNSVVIFP